MLLKLISKLPLGLLYLVADALYVMTYHVTGWRKDLAYGNLKNAFPEKDDRELRRIAKGVYRNFADVIVEAVKAMSITEAQLVKRVNITNPEILEEFAQKGQAVILMAAHQCNWEWLLLASRIKLAFPVDGVYKSLRNRSIDKFMLEMRSRFGGDPIPSKSIILEIMKRKDRVKGIAMVADQTPVKGEEKYWTQFMNQDTAFHVGIEKIAKITKFPVFFVRMKRIKRGYYEVSLTSIARPPYTNEGYPILERYVRETENQVREHPFDWFWLYRKWKYKKPLYAR